MGQLRKRWNVWWIRYYRNAKRIEESTGTSKYDDARDLLKKREGAVADGVPLTAQSTKLKFDDAVKDVVTAYTVNKRPSKPELDRRIKLHLTPFFGGRRLRAITSEADVREGLGRLKSTTATVSGDSPPDVRGRAKVKTRIS